MCDITSLLRWRDGCAWVMHPYGARMARSCFVLLGLSAPKWPVFSVTVAFGCCTPTAPEWPGLASSCMAHRRPNGPVLCLCCRCTIARVFWEVFLSFSLLYSKCRLFRRDFRRSVVTSRLAGGICTQFPLGSWFFSLHLC